MSAHDPRFGDWRTTLRAVASSYRAQALYCTASFSLILGAVADLPDASPSDRIVDQVMGVGATIALGVLLRRFSQGRGLWRGLVLAVLSVLWGIGLINAVITVWLIAMWSSGQPTEPADIITSAVAGVVLLIRTDRALKKRRDAADDYADF
jgi:hypothetical protein